MLRGGKSFHQSRRQLQPAEDRGASARTGEEDQVLLLFETLGTAPNTAIQAYLNDNKVPQLFVSSGADKWNDPKNHPWTMGWLPSYRVESRIYAHYILENLPDAKIAVLYQNDDFGKDYLNGLREGLGDKADKLMVTRQSYETTDPTVDSQIVALEASGANVLLTAAIPKFAAQAIREVYDIGWKSTHFLSSVANSVGSVGRRDSRKALASSRQPTPKTPPTRNGRARQNTMNG